MNAVRFSADHVAVYTTSSAVNGVPSCHLMSWRSLNVKVVASGEISQLSAIRGLRVWRVLSLRSSATRVSKTR